MRALLLAPLLALATAPAGQALQANPQAYALHAMVVEMDGTDLDEFVRLLDARITRMTTASSIRRL